MNTSGALIRVALDALAVVVADDPQGSSESDVELLDMTRDIEGAARLIEVLQSRRAAEISRRSRRELGHAGLASVHGHVSAPALVRSVTRSSFAEAQRRIRVGTLLNNAAATHLHQPQTDEFAADAGMHADGLGPTEAEQAVDASFTALAEAVADGSLGVDAADKVLRILEPVVSDLDPEQLRKATSALAAESTALDADRIGERAREIRDTVNRVGVQDREEHLRQKRALKRGCVRDGLRYVSLVLDPESDLLLLGAIDAVMSPRLGGPRFTDPDKRAQAQSLVDDARTNEQIAIDTLVGLVTAGVNANPTIMPASGTPVRVTMTVSDLTDRIADGGHLDSCELALYSEKKRSPGDHDNHQHADSLDNGVSLDKSVSLDHHSNLYKQQQQRTANGGNCTCASTTGVAMLEGHPELVSAATARRYLCNSGALPVVLSGDSVPLDLGRTQRLFSHHQRVALAVRDRGCRWPECDRPPSWTESHHIEEYQHGGKTDLRDGIALCRRHHQLLHNNGWQILRHDRIESPPRADPDQPDPCFWLRPPKSLDPSQTLRPMPPNRASPRH